MIEFACPACSKWLRAADEYAGKRSKCRGCGEVVTVPSPEGSYAIEPETVQPPSEIDDSSMPLPQPLIPALPPVIKPPQSPRSGHDQEPWYYGAIDGFAQIELVLGVIQFGFGVLAAMTGEIANLSFLFIVSASILVGSLLTALPIFLMVDLARNVRRMRIAAEVNDDDDD